MEVSLLTGASCGLAESYGIATPAQSASVAML
jgi:hypothetical protein